jgi:hypothetical protein
MANDSAKVLRIGLVLRGRIVEERILRRPATVTIGRSQRCTLALPQSDLPESFDLLPHGGSGYALAFDDRMDGRISSPQGSLDFEQLMHFGAAKKKGSVHVAPLEVDQWGRVAIGEATVLFQFVVPPPDAPRPRLPAVVRGNRFKSMDGLFASLLAISLVLHVSAYAGLSTIPVREEVTLEEIPDRFAKLLIPERKPEAPKQETKQEVVEEKKEEKKPDKKPGDDSPANKAERAAAVAKAVQQKGILRVLGALGPGSGRGAVADVFGQGGFGDVASALSGAGGVAVATDGAGAGGRKGGGGGGAATIGDLGTSGGGKVGLGAKSEVRVSGSVGVEDAEVDSPDIDQQKLSGFVRARMAAIKACYENQLKRNPNLKGKIRIRFTILETGGLADVAAVENTLGSTEVAACIVGTMRTWRTPFRPAGTVPVDYPFVFSAN